MRSNFYRLEGLAKNKRKQVQNGNTRIDAIHAISASSDLFDEFERAWKVSETVDHCISLKKHKWQNLLSGSRSYSRGNWSF